MAKQKGTYMLLPIPDSNNNEIANYKISSEIATCFPVTHQQFPYCQPAEYSLLSVVGLILYYLSNEVQHAIVMRTGLAWTA